MASMEKEFFWGCELSKDKKEHSWDSEDEELSKADIEQKLVVSQACLGLKAKANERNLVQVTTTDSSDNTVTFTIVSLTFGKSDQCRLSLAFPSSATFKLVEGSGPVHLTGSVYQELYLLEDEDEESDEDDDEIVKSEAKVNVGSKKRPLASETPKGPPKKLARVEVDEEESEDDDEDDEDEDESTEESPKMEVDNKQKQKKTEETPKTAKNKPENKEVKVKKKDAEEESEEEEDSEDESDDDDDQEEEESGEEESEEDESDEDDDDEEDESDEEDEITTSLTAKKQEAKEVKRKPITNGVVKEDKKKKQEKSKTPAQQPSTPKTSAKKDDVKKAGSKTPQPLDMEKIKEKLLKTPNLPRKVDKFKNYMKHSHKVTDEAELTKLWNWVKENK